MRQIVVATRAVTTLAGTAGQNGLVNAMGMMARFGAPKGIAYDASTASLYVADAGNEVIRRVDVATGAVTTFVGDGQGGQAHGGGAPGFKAVGAMATDGAGSLYVVDGPTIRRVAITTRLVTTLVGLTDDIREIDGNGTDARVAAPRALLPDGHGALYFTDCDTVRRLDLPTGDVVTLYGEPSTNPSDGLLGCVTDGHRVLRAE